MARPRLRELANEHGWLLLLPITFLGCWLRAKDVDTWWINADEGIYYSMTAWSDWDRFWAECAGNAHPPLYYLLLRGIAALTDSFVWMRAVALLCGTLAVPATWWLVREAMGGGGRVAALLAALAVALSPNLIVLSQLMRPYMLQLVMVTAAAAALCRWQRLGRNRVLVVYALGLSLAVLTHYSSLMFAAIAGGACVAWVLLRRPPRRAVGTLALANLAPFAIAVALWFLHLRPRLIGSALAKDALEGWLRPYMVTDLASAWRSVLGFFAYLGGQGFEGPLTLAFLAGLGVAAWQRRWLLLTLPLATLLLALAGAAAQKYPFGCCRHTSWLASILILPVAVAVASALTRSWRVAVPSLVVFVALTGWRGPVSLAMGTRPALTRPADERVLSTANMARIQSIWAGIPGTPGTLLMGAQTYYMLVPILHRQREAARLASDGTFHWFPWGERTVLVSTAWDILLAPAAAAEPNHLDNLARSIDRELPQLGFARSREVLMVFAGWSWQVPSALFDLDAKRPHGQKLMKNVLSVDGLVAFDYDLATLRHELQPLLEQHRRGR
jgi:hypothetical protein